MSGECTVHPRKGISLVTLFNVTCSNVSHIQPVSFNLYQISNADVLVATSDIGTFTVQLAAGRDSFSKLYVKIVDPDNLYIVKNITVEVTSFVTQVEEEEKMNRLIKTYDGLLAKILTAKDTDNLTQLINVVSAEATLIKGHDLLKRQLKKKITENLQEFQFHTQTKIAQASSAIKTVWNICTEQDRDFTISSLLAAQYIVNGQLKLLDNAPFPDQLDLEVKENIQNLLLLVNGDLEAFPSETEIRDVTFVVTVPSSLLTFPVVSENYEDYKDADFYYVHRLRDYEQITKSAVRVVTLIGLTVARTLVPGEPIINVTDKPNVVQVLSDSPNRLANTKLGTYDAQILGPSSLVNIEDYVSGVITVYDKNPYWWHKTYLNVSTKVIHANYFVKNEAIIKMEAQIQLFFAANWSYAELIDGKIKIPDNVNLTVLEKYLAVHRVDLKEGAALIVDFVDVEDNLDVVITYNKRPRLVDFNFKNFSLSKGTTTKSFLYPEHLGDFGNAWFYICFLPANVTIQSKIPTSISITYKISFITSLCSYWSDVFEEWISSDCQTGPLTTKNRIHCFCVHHSSYVGSYLITPNLKHPYVEFSLILKSYTYWSVFSLILLLCLIYCVLLTFVALESLHNFRKALYLPDNYENYNYYYLIIVKTGSRRFSGTSSNVGLQLFGLIGKSHPHIINFPDPYRKLLQRNSEDWFVLAVDKDLKYLNNIGLWFDSVGSSPSWYCKWITIVDLQNEKRWNFSVNTLLSVLDDGYCKISIKTSNRQEPNSWRNLIDSHNWNFVTLFRKNNRLPNQNRLTIMLSTSLTVLLITLILFHLPSLHKSYGLGYGHYQIVPFIFLSACLSSLAGFFLNTIFVIIFRRENFKRFQKIPWVALIVWIMFTITLLLTFAPRMSYIDSLLWLTSASIAIAIVIIFLETLYVAWSEEGYENDNLVDVEEVLTDVKHQKHMLIENLGKELLRPLLKNKYRSLTIEEYKAKREKEICRRGLAIVFQDLIMFIIYFILLFFIILANRDSINAYSNKEITDLLITNQFNEISTLDQLYNYINGTLITTLHSINWYGAWNTLQPGLISDFNTKILGIARIRQQRVCENCCKISSLFLNFTLRCKPEYSSSTHIENSFVEFWKPSQHVAVPRLALTWTYTHDSVNKFGYFRLYPVGGYSGPLGRTTYNSYYNLKYYFDTNWMDYNSRVFFVEFLSYNVNYNMFHVVTLIIEKSATGLIHTTYDIISTRLLFLKYQVALLVVIEMIMFIIIATLMLLKSVYFAKIERKKHLKNIWNIVDCFLSVMSFSCLGIYWYRTNSVGKFLNDLETTKHNRFLDYFGLIRVDYLLIVMAAVLVCMATVRLWKFLRFIPDFRVFEQTIVQSGKLLIGLAFCHLLTWCVYVIAGDVLFGSQMHYFHRIHSSLTTLMLLSVNLYAAFDSTNFMQVGGVYAYMYFVSYTIAMMTIYSFYVSLLMIYYSDCNSEYSNLNEYYSVRKYISDELRCHKTLFWKRIFRLRAGEEDEIQNKATPKSDGYRYADAIVLSEEELLAMLVISKNIVDRSNQQEDESESIANCLYYLTNAKRKSNYDSSLIGYALPEEENNNDDENDQSNVVFDQRLKEMEYVANQILSKGFEENSKFEEFEKNSQEETYLKLNQAVNNIEHLDNALLSLSLISDIVVSINVSCDQSCKKCNENFNCFHVCVKNNL